MGNKIFYHNYQRDNSEQYIKIESKADMCKLIKQNKDETDETKTYLKVSHFIIKDGKLNIYVFETHKKKVKVDTKKDLSGGRAKRFSSFTTVARVEEREIYEYKNPYLFASIPLVYGIRYSETQKDCIQVEFEKYTWDTIIRQAVLASPECHDKNIKITYNALIEIKSYNLEIYTLNLTTNKYVEHCKKSEYITVYKEHVTPVTAPIKF